MGRRYHACRSIGRRDALYRDGSPAMKPAPRGAAAGSGRSRTTVETGAPERRESLAATSGRPDTKGDRQ
jgi:hypothetical protein